MTIRMLDYKSYNKPVRKACKKGRVERRDIERLVTDLYIIVLEEDQYFCETDKTYEIWREGEDRLPHFVKRIRKTSVLWVVEK